MGNGRIELSEFVKEWLKPEKRENLREAVEVLAFIQLGEEADRLVPQIRGAERSSTLLQMLAALARADIWNECMARWRQGPPLPPWPPGTPGAVP